ncbi:MAG: DUF2510 domain-containing protein [Candidatus Nanopelagicales bacterium]
MSDQTPAAGWYPDPADPAQHRYWDGMQWTAETSGWGDGWRSQPPGGPPASAYAPATGELAPSGMRRLPALFDDVGRIIRRAWWQLVLVGLVIWVVVAAALAAVGAALVDFAALDRALTVTEDLAATKGPVAQDTLTSAWTAVLRIDSPVAWAVAGIGSLVLLILASSVQIAACNRLGIDAAAGLPVRLAEAWRSGFVGGVRLFGYFLLWTVIILALTALWIVLIAVSAMTVPPLAVLIAIAGVGGLITLGVFVYGRFAPLTVQAVVAPHALRWSWGATRTTFWAVLGRALLWSVVASVASQVVLSVVMIPFSLFGMGVLGTSMSSPGAGPLHSTVAAVALSLLTMPITMVMAALSYVGIVPIWRDLTDDPDYRSIGADGRPVPAPN